MLISVRKNSVKDFLKKAKEISVVDANHICKTKPRESMIFLDLGNDIYIAVSDIRSSNFNKEDLQGSIHLRGCDIEVSFSAGDFSFFPYSKIYNLELSDYQYNRFFSMDYSELYHLSFEMNSFYNIFWNK